MKNLGIFLFVFTFVLVSCWKREEKSKVSEIEYKIGDLDDVPERFLVPKQLVKAIKKHFVSQVRFEKPLSVDSDEKILSKIPRKRLPMEVLFSQKETGPLFENLKFDIPVGSGVIDFKHYVVGKTGSFFLQVRPLLEINGEEMSVGNLRVFYLSHSKQVKIDKRGFGMGCDKVVDISSWARKNLISGKLQLNATEGRYIRTLGGIFVFALANKGILYLSSLKFQDSRFQKDLCPNV